jgi:hypothetical protein
MALDPFSTRPGFHFAQCRGCHESPLDQPFVIGAPQFGENLQRFNVHSGRGEIVPHMVEISLEAFACQPKKICSVP